MKHQDKASPIYSGDNQSQNMDDKNDLFCIDFWGTKKGITSTIFFHHKDVIYNSEESVENGSYDEIDIEEIDQPHRPVQSRKRSMKK